jgi:hypothetical protein
MKFRYRYSKLQEKLISKLKETNVKFRIRRDRTVEFAKKCYPDIDVEVNEMRFQIFEKPVIYKWSSERNINDMLHLLAEKNIPFLVENYDDTEFIIYNEIDVDDIVKIENELGINQIVY